MATQSVHDEEIIFGSKYAPVEVPKDQTLHEFVLCHAEPYLDNVAVVDSVTGQAYTYREVRRDVARFSKALRSLGLRKGHVVVVLLPNVAEYATIALGIMAAGGVFSGANPSGLAGEIKKQIEAADAKIIVTDGSTFHKVKDLGLPILIQGETKHIEGTIKWDELLEAADKANTDFIDEKVLQTDLCALPFSSGTTGLSKGVMLTHENLVANLCSSLFGVGPELIGQVSVLGLIPFFHIYGLTGICCATMRNKGKVVVMQRYELRLFLNALITHQVTFAPVVPPIIISLVKNPIVQEFDLTKLSLKSIMTAAAPLAPEILNEFENKFPGVQVQEAYGMTEHSCITLTHGNVNLGVAKKNSVGFILPNIEVKFVDPETGKSLPKNTPGEICVWSKCVMKGYYKNEYETERTIDKDGWLHTGDIGYIDDDGDVFIVDRIKELIKYKGFQVAPAELEAILLSHPSVQDAAVVGCKAKGSELKQQIDRSLSHLYCKLTPSPSPLQSDFFPIANDLFTLLADEEAGEVPAASVVRKVGAKENEEELIKYVSANVATYKRVRVLQFVDAIPKSPSGKIMRRVIRDNMEKKL